MADPSAEISLRLRLLSDFCFTAMEPTTDNNSWNILKFGTRKQLRIMAICVGLLSLAGYTLLWDMPLREMLPAMVAPLIRTRAMPTPPAQNWVFGNLEPDSPWQFNAEALEKVRKFTSKLKLKTRLREHKYGKVKNKSLPIGHYNTCAVVGNSGVLLGSNCGAEIDSMDYVIRIDVPVLRGFEKDVGGRTSMTVLNRQTPERMVASLGFKNRSLDVYESRFQDVKDSVLLADKRSIGSIMKALKVYKLPFSVLTPKDSLRSRSMKIASNITHKKMKWVSTTGLVTVLMTTTFCDHLYMYGFFPFMKDMNNVTVPYHYFTHDHVNDSSSLALVPWVDGFGEKHNVNEEYDFHRELHRRGALKMQLGPCEKR